MREQKPVRPGPLQQNLPGSAAVEDKNGMERVAGGKSVRPRSFEHKPLRPEPLRHEPLRPGATMHTDVQTRKSRGRLNRETLNKLGKVLEAYFDDVRNQGVPERFKQLLAQF